MPDNRSARGVLKSRLSKCATTGWNAVCAGEAFNPDMYREKVEFQRNYERGRLLAVEMQARGYPIRLVRAGEDLRSDDLPNAVIRAVNTLS